MQCRGPVGYLCVHEGSIGHNFVNCDIDINYSAIDNASECRYLQLNIQSCKGGRGLKPQKPPLWLCHCNYIPIIYYLNIL